MSSSPQTPEVSLPEREAPKQVFSEPKAASASPVVEPLRRAADGLLFLSETDAPLTPFFWPDVEASTLTPGRVSELAGVSAEEPIKTVKLESFFRNATKAEEWHNDEEKAEVERFKALVKTIKDTLDDVKVFRVGETKIEVYIAGKTEGGYAGLQTHVVET